MKRFLFIIFIVQASVFAGGEWIFINSPTNQNLTHISFSDSLYGWVSGDSGSFYLTNDGGDSWKPLNLGTINNIQDHFFFDKKNGWAVTWEIDTTFNFSSSLYRTKDSGNTWQAFPFNQLNFVISSIYFFDTLNGLAGGGGGEFLYTDDGGERWNRAELDTNTVSGFKIFNFNFLNDKFGYACGGKMDAAGTIYRTTNSGRTWYGGNLTYLTEPVYSVMPFDSLSAVAFTGDVDFGTFILRTYDGGFSWEKDSINFYGIPEASAKRTDDEIWVSLGFSGKLMLTVDSLRTWNSVYAPDSVKINDMCFTDTVHGFAAATHYINFETAEGKILKFRYKKPVAIFDYNPANISSFSVSCYPNPFNPSTTIEYTIPNRSFVKIRLYDILGRDAGLIFYGEQQPGTYKYPVSLASLSTGVYICAVTTGKEASFIKLLYLK